MDFIHVKNWQIHDIFTDGSNSQNSTDNRFKLQLRADFDK